MKPTPFVKWAGGKTQLLKEYRDYYPKQFSAYYEPFVGGGAVFFHLNSLNRIRRAILSDSNPELMNLWAAVKFNVEELIVRIQSLQSMARSSSDYYENRKKYNSIALKKGFLSKPNIEKASLLMYLNRTCYNGLYRVNAKGEFNVPFGRYKNPRLVDAGNLRSVSDRLQDEGRVKLRCEDFERAVVDAKREDFVYFDPPYQPLSATSSFTGYTKAGFGVDEQRRLSNLFKELDGRGCFVLLSNSHTQDVLRPMYEEYFPDRVRLVKASRAINCVGTSRGHIKELLVMNYSVQKRLAG